MSEVEFEALVPAASRRMGERKTGNSEFWEFNNPRDWDQVEDKDL